MEKITNEESIIEIKSVQLTKSLLSDLCKLLNDENMNFNKEQADKKSQLEFLIETKNKKIETNDSEVFLRDGVPQKFNEIKLYFRGGDKRIKITFDTIFDIRRFTVEGIDSVWVNGITRKLENLFQKYDTKNGFFHTKKSWVIYFGIAIVLAASAYFSLSPFVSDKPLDELPIEIQIFEIFAVVLWIVLVNSVMGWALLFRQLFPLIETENSISIKIRKWIIGGIIAILVSILANVVLSFIQSFST